MTGTFIDGTGITPGSEKCKCAPDCEFPCWQRLGIAPACELCGCPPLPGACRRCGDRGVISVAGPDENGQYDTDDCPDCQGKS